MLSLKEGGLNGKKTGLVLSNFAEDGGEAAEASTNSNPGPAMRPRPTNVLTSDTTLSNEIVTTGEKCKRTANKWYSMKNFEFRHDGEDSDDDIYL